jgi:hypothetical protein
MRPRTWFERLTGVEEIDAEHVRAQFECDGPWLRSRGNGRRLRHGSLSMPSLAELRARAKGGGSGRRRVRQVVGDAGALHADPDHAGALFQVASQFNLLEMVDPGRTPEDGIGCYEDDHTQGPACAIAAGAATIHRNYFVPLPGGLGQTAQRQIDCSAELGLALGNRYGSVWRMQNGYLLPTPAGLAAVAARLRAVDEAERDRLRGLLRIGLHQDTEVTLHDRGHLVAQAFCSALPIAYSGLPAPAWEPFARLVLEAAYEATLLAAAEQAAPAGGNRCFLTLLGGGAFGNPVAWIVAAAARALELHRQLDLEVVFVSHGAPHPAVTDLVASYGG